MKIRHGLIVPRMALGIGCALAQTTWKTICTTRGSGAPETVVEGHILWGASARSTGPRTYAIDNKIE
jgi:hypothetical protein